MVDLAGERACSSLGHMAGKGRPRKDPTAGKPSVHLGMRIDKERAAKLDDLVEDANRRAREHGIAATVTKSSLVLMWIGERIEAEHPKLEPRKKR